MEMQGRGEKQFFADAGDGAMANLHRELMQMKRSTQRCQRILTALLAIFGIILLALIIVVAIDARRIHRLKQREGLLPHPNVTFASNSGDKSVNGLTYGGSLFRGSGFWATRQSLPNALTDHAAIAVDDQVYIIGGALDTANATDQVWRYSSILHSYAAVAPMPTPRYSFGAALDPTSRKIYVVGGRSDPSATGSDSTTAIYDIATDLWSTGAIILTPGSDQCAGYLSGKIYLTGGYSPDYAEYLTATQIYDIEADKWSTGPALPTARGDLMCTEFGGEFFAVGGYVNNGSADQNSFSDKVESYNPNTTSWTTQPPLLTPRGDGAIAVLPGDRLMVVGGEGHYNNSQDYKYPKHTNEVYYATDKTWVEKAMIPTARFRTAAATVGGLAYVFGGADTCVNASSPCPAFVTAEVFLDVDHPHVYVYLKNEAYNDNAALTTYPL